MHKRARPRREMLTSPPPAPKFLSNREGQPGHHHPLVALGHAAPGANGRSGGFGGADSAQAGILSPVSHCAQKLGTLHHWAASPGSANPPATAARPAGAPGHPFGLGATPHPLTVEPSAGGRFAPATAATPFDRHAADFRRDLAPIRSTGGLTFAEALARNSSGDLSDPDALGAKRKADALDLPPADFELHRRAPSPPASPRAAVGTLDGTLDGTLGTPGVGTHMDADDAVAEPTEVSGAFSPLQEGPPSLLPAETDEHGLPCVTPEVAARVLSQCAAGTMRAHFIDVRYPHEFRAGHVRGAVNAHDPAEVQRFLSARLAEDRRRADAMLREGAASRAHASAGTAAADGLGASGFSQNSAFIFYCDHSTERAPRMWRHVRNLDRRDHVMDYPALSFPHAYVLRGGYAAFVAEQAENGWCTGAHVRVDESLWVEESRAAAGALRSAWHLARMAKGIGHVVVAGRGDANAAGRARWRDEYEPREVFEDDDMME